MVQANDVARPKSRHSERMPLVLGGTQLHGETLISGLYFDGTPVYVGLSLLSAKKTMQL